MVKVQIAGMFMTAKLLTATVPIAVMQQLN
jgi:hypothetical protein